MTSLALKADEIADEAVDRVLATEFQAVQSAPAQAPRERLLHVDRRAAHLAGGGAQERLHTSVRHMRRVTGAPSFDPPLIRLLRSHLLPQGEKVRARLGRRALGSEPPAEFDVRADDNVEMVSRLAEDAEAGLDHAIPGDVVLPPGSVEDRLRWVRSWPEIGPAETVSWLGLGVDAPWREIVLAAYRRFPDHWAAGVAYRL